MLETLDHISSIINSAVTVIFCVFMALKTGPNYKRQKRIENNTDAAKDALVSLENCEKSLRQLFTVTKLARSHESHLPAQNEALANLTTLKNRLLLLGSNPSIKENLLWLQELIKKFHPRHETVSSFTSSSVLSEIDARYHEEKDLNLYKLEEIRVTLIAIYELSEIDQDQLFDKNQATGA
jgi:hypothetical protein